MSTDAAPLSAPELNFLANCIWTAWTKRKAIQPRGFDSIRDRAKLMAEIDEYLEDLFLEMLRRDHL